MGCMLCRKPSGSHRSAWLAMLAAVAAVLAVLAAAGSASAAPASGSYLSLGDSLAFGYQPNLVAAGDFDPTDYRSYAEDFAAMRPDLQLTNLGCPGETTGTMIHGGCPWLALGLPLHSPYPAGASQLDAALAFLGSHPQTSLISVDIGSNDLLAALGGCNYDLGCVEATLPATLHDLQVNYAAILTALRAAAPSAQLVLFNLYNPLVLALPGSDQLLAPVNTLIDGLAGAFGAQVADAFGVMNHAAGSPAERAFVCTRTWECSSYQNIHPTDLGYQQMAIALLHATK